MKNRRDRITDMRVRQRRVEVSTALDKVWAGLNITVGMKVLLQRPDLIEPLFQPRVIAEMMVMTNDVFLSRRTPNELGMMLRTILRR